MAALLLLGTLAFQPGDLVVEVVDRLLLGGEGGERGSIEPLRLGEGLAHTGGLDGELVVLILDAFEAAVDAVETFVDGVEPVGHLLAEFHEFNSDGLDDALPAGDRALAGGGDGCGGPLLRRSDGGGDGGRSSLRRGDGFGDNQSGVKDLWQRDLVSGKSNPVLPGLRIEDYEISRDETQVAYTTVGAGGERDIFLATADRSTSPHLVAAGIVGAGFRRHAQRS